MVVRERVALGIGGVVFATQPRRKAPVLQVKTVFQISGLQVLRISKGVAVAFILLPLSTVERERTEIIGLAGIAVFGARHQLCFRSELPGDTRFSRDDEEGQKLPVLHTLFRYGLQRFIEVVILEIVFTGIERLTDITQEKQRMLMAGAKVMPEVDTGVEKVHGLLDNLAIVGQPDLWCITTADTRVAHLVLVFSIMIIPEIGREFVVISEVIVEIGRDVAIQVVHLVLGISRIIYFVLAVVGVFVHQQTAAAHGGTASDVETELTLVVSILHVRLRTEVGRKIEIAADGQLRSCLALPGGEDAQHTSRAFGGKLGRRVGDDFYLLDFFRANGLEIVHQPLAGELYLPIVDHHLNTRDAIDGQTAAAMPHAGQLVEQRLSTVAYAEDAVADVHDGAVTFVSDGGSHPRHVDLAQRIAVGLQADGAKVGRGSGPQLRLVAHVGHLGDDASYIAGNDEIATLVAHASGKERRVGGREQHHIGILGGLTLVVNHAALVSQCCLL